MNNIFSQLLGATQASSTNAQSSNSSSSPSTTSNSTTTPSPSSIPAAGGLSGLFNSNSIQDYMQQIMQNPRQMESIMNTPYMQSTLQMLSSNPEMARLIIDSSPQIAGNPELREQITRSLPAMLQQVYMLLVIEIQI
jgi:hypothetical protein